MPIGCKRATIAKLEKEVSARVSLSRTFVPSGNECAEFMKQPTRLTSEVRALTFAPERNSTISACAIN